jgi:mitochondrial fission protein ELM1
VRTLANFSIITLEAPGEEDVTSLAHGANLSNFVSRARQKIVAAAAGWMETMADALQAVAGRRGWIISDGKAGHEAQARGVAEALGLAVEIKRVMPGAPWSLLSPWGPVAPSERFGSPASPFHPPWPDFAFAIGRLTIPYIRKLKQMAGLATYTVILLDPKVSAKTADLFWVPEHDKLRGPNVITTLTAPHTFSPRRLAELRTRMPAGLRRCRPRVSRCCSGAQRRL